MRSRNRAVLAIAPRGALLVAGTTSDAGKSVLTTGICRWLRRSGWLHARDGVLRRLLYPPTDVGPVGLSRLVAMPDAFRRLGPSCPGTKVTGYGIDQAYLWYRRDGAAVADAIRRLFEGRGIAERWNPQTGEGPNRITLYRRAILDYWAENDETLGSIVTHVLIHEIGHHFGLSDDDMEAIEAKAEEESRRAQPGA